MKAMKAEWERPWEKNAPNWKDARKLGVAARMARKAGEQIHVARIFGICVEKL